MAHAFETAHRTVWYDHDLQGGEMWWETILRNIRETSVFLFAMSDHSLESKACLAELAYAGALQRPILPVQVGHVSAERSHLLAGRQAVTFRVDDAVTGFAVLDAADNAAKKVGPLPDPMPIEPPIPFAYLGEIRRRIEGGELDNAAQLDLITKLRLSLGEETDSSARRDILKMLTTLRDRPWRTVQAGLEIHAVFAAYELIERELSGGPTQPIQVPQGIDVPKPTPEWSEDDAREAFLQRIGELVGELHAGKACQEAKGTAELTATEVLRNALVGRDDLELGTDAGAATGLGYAAPPRYFAGVNADQEGVPGFLPGAAAGPAGPADPPTRSRHGETAQETPPPLFFPGVRQASSPHDFPTSPVIPRQRPNPQPAGGAPGRPTAAFPPTAFPPTAFPPTAFPPTASPPTASPPTARWFAVAALVVCAAFAALVAATGRDAAAGVFALPAVAAIVALIFSAQVQRRTAAGNIASARRASVVTKVWAAVALGIAVAVLAAVLNSVPVTG